MVCDVLNRKGTPCSYKTVYAYMKEMKIKATILVKPKPCVSKGKKHYIFDNQVDREFYATRPNEIWCSDFTQFKLKNGKKRYNYTILDLYDRSVVATLNSKFIDAELAVRTLEKALKSNKSNNPITLHTDYAEEKIIPKKSCRRW